MMKVFERVELILKQSLAEFVDRHTIEIAGERYKAKKNIIVLKRNFISYGRTVADSHPEGFIKVITNKRGRIFRVTIISETASEIIHEWILAI